MFYTAIKGVKNYFWRCKRPLSWHSCGTLSQFNWWWSQSYSFLTVALLYPSLSHVNLLICQDNFFFLKKNWIVFCQITKLKELTAGSNVCQHKGGEIEGSWDLPCAELSIDSAACGIKSLSLANYEAQQPNFQTRSTDFSFLTGTHHLTMNWIIFLLKYLISFFLFLFLLQYYFFILLSFCPFLFTYNHSPSWFSSLLMLPFRGGIPL